MKSLVQVRLHQFLRNGFNRVYALLIRQQPLHPQISVDYWASISVRQILGKYLLLQILLSIAYFMTKVLYLTSLRNFARLPWKLFQCVKYYGMPKQYSALIDNLASFILWYSEYFCLNFCIIITRSNQSGILIASDNKTFSLASFYRLKYHSRLGKKFWFSYRRTWSWKKMNENIIRQ